MNELVQSTIRFLYLQKSVLFKSAFIHYSYVTCSGKLYPSAFVNEYVDLMYKFDIRRIKMSHQTAELILLQYRSGRTVLKVAFLI